MREELEKGKEKEIDLRALINGNLKYDPFDLRPVNLLEEPNVNLVPRKFESWASWDSVSKTSYIESILLRCTLNPIIRFKNERETTIVDGLNRYLTLQEFINNKFVLRPQGLKKLKFLANKKFKDFTKDEVNYFKDCESIRVLDYYYHNADLPNKTLTEEEEIEIQKYLHLIYNTNIKLDIAEVQKAEFSNDDLTNMIKNKLLSDSKFMELAEAFKLTSGKKKSLKLENILLNSRLLIASTYSNINDYATASNVEYRIEKTYLPALRKKRLEEIFQQFVVNLNQIYAGMIDTQIWLKYPELHTKQFLECTYWLISVIRNDALIDPFTFNFIDYLDYFGPLEKEEKNFIGFQSHFRKHIFDRYQKVATYFQKTYGIDMSSYFKIEENNDSDDVVINSIEELRKRGFSCTPISMRIQDILVEMNEGNYSLTPHYQRKEVINIELSSRIIESLILGIELPYILVYKKYKGSKGITEVVDGQQRLWSIIAFLMAEYKDENEQTRRSLKDGFALKNLRILSELNGKKKDSKKREEVIEKDIISKIENTKLYFSRITDDNDGKFNAEEHFVRLNKNICSIKDNTYRLWSLTADRKIIEYVKKVTDPYVNIILPKNDTKRLSYCTTLKLAYLQSHKKYKDLTSVRLRNESVTTWLCEFNKIKNKLLDAAQDDKVSEIRQSYLDALDGVKKYYDKISKFLGLMECSLKDLMAIEEKNSIPKENYIFLFSLLNDISEENIVLKKKEIFNILQEFFVKKSDGKPSDEEKLDMLNFAKQQILAQCKVSNF